MKITIAYTTEEKNTLTNMMLGFGGINEVVDKDEHLIGSFGEFKYDHNTNEITIDLKTAFIKASACLTVSIINMVKSLVGTCEMFTESWLSDVKDMTKKEENSEEEQKQDSDSTFKSEVEKELSEN